MTPAGVSCFTADEDKRMSSVGEGASSSSYHHHHHHHHHHLVSFFFIVCVESAGFSKGAFNNSGPSQGSIKLPPSNI